MDTAQTIAEDFTEVAAKTKTLLDSLQIATIHNVSIKNFGSTKWLIVVIYD